MREERIQVVMDLYIEVDEEELNRENGNPEDLKITWPELRDDVINQLEEAVKECGNGSSIHFSFAEENTKVTKSK